MKKHLKHSPLMKVEKQEVLNSHYVGRRNPKGKCFSCSSQSTEVWIYRSLAGVCKLISLDNNRLHEVYCVVMHSYYEILQKVLAVVQVSHYSPSASRVNANLKRQTKHHIWHKGTHLHKFSDSRPTAFPYAGETKVLQLLHSMLLKECEHGSL